MTVNRSASAHRASSPVTVTKDSNSTGTRELVQVSESTCFAFAFSAFQLLIKCNLFINTVSAFVFPSSFVESFYILAVLSSINLHFVSHILLTVLKIEIQNLIEPLLCLMCVRLINRETRQQNAIQL